MLRQRIKRTLRHNRSRVMLAAGLFGILLYFIVYRWVSLPSLTLVFGWYPDTALMAVNNVDEAYQSDFEPGDVVLEIDGEPVRRGQQIFAPPLQSAYTLTIERGDQVFTQRVELDEASETPYRRWLLTVDVAAVVFWLIGAATLLLAADRQPATLYIGVGLQMTGIWILSPGPAQLGAPGAWLVGHVLIYFFPTFVLYLGAFPLEGEMKRPLRRLLTAGLVVSSALALLAAFEYLFLFPERSVTDVIGTGMVEFLRVTTGAASIISFIVLLLRVFYVQARPYEQRQLAILLFFFTLAVVPVFLFVLLPTRHFLLVPLPFVYSLALFIPIGYFFVFARRGILQLDLIFSRLIVIVLLALALSMIYATGAYFIDLILPQRLQNLAQGGWLVGAFGLVIANQRYVQTFVDWLLYGQDRLNEDLLQNITSRLSANPDPRTLSAAVCEIADRLHIPHAAVVAHNGTHYTLTAATHNITPLTLTCAVQPHQIYLRIREPETFAAFPTWSDLCIPITMRTQVLGLFLLSRPANGYFDANQVDSLQGLAGVLAFSLQVMRWLKAEQSRAAQTLYAHKLQQSRFASEIHNSPLHDLSVIATYLQDAPDHPAVDKIGQGIRQVMKKLRRIMADVHPDVLNKALPLMVRHTVQEFSDNHQDLRVVSDIKEKYEHEDGWPSKATRHAVYNVLREALNNVIRHAQATQVEINFAYDADTITLRVIDNGCGIGEAFTAPNELVPAQHYGVADMHTWAEVGGGYLTIGAHQGGGTAVSLWLPAHWDVQINRGDRQQRNDT